MKKGAIIIILVTIIFLVIAFFIFRTINAPELSPEIKCETLTYNGEGKTNLVFFSDKYNAEKYSSYLLETDPFIDYQNQFNIFYINHKPECELYQGKAVLCYNKQLVKTASICPNDYIIVINNEHPRKIRSAAYMNSVSVNAKQPLTVLTHEFGHAFANLADEYVPSKPPKKSQNCQSNCEDFPIKDGCFKGCSEAELSRSINSGVMRTLTTNDYGTLNKELVTESINKQSTSITGHSIQDIIDCQEQEYYLIHLLYDSGQISVVEKAIEQGCVNSNGNGPYEYNLIFKDGSIRNVKGFNPELVFTDFQDIEQEQIDGGSIEYSGDFFLKIPLIEELKEIEILIQNKSLIEISLIETEKTKISTSRQNKIYVEEPITLNQKLTGTISIEILNGEVVQKDIPISLILYKESRVLEKYETTFEDFLEELTPIQMSVVDKTCEEANCPIIKKDYYFNQPGVYKKPIEKLIDYTFTQGGAYSLVLIDYSKEVKSTKEINIG